MITIDGNHGEGGGQIVRTAVALSIITGKEIRVENIRAGREKPGLKAQHVQAITAAQALCDGKAANVKEGSEWIEFVPGKLKKKNLEIDIGTAGSITLALQTLLLPLIFVGKTVKVTIVGGTDVAWSAPINHFMHVLLPLLKSFADFHCVIFQRGYFPKGKGKIELTVRPWKELPDFIKRNYENEQALFPSLIHIPPFDLVKQEPIVFVRGVSHASADLENNRVAERMAKTVQITLNPLRVPITIEQSYRQTESPGAGIDLFARSQNNIISASALGKKGVSSEQLGNNAAQELLREISTGAVLDEHTTDQILPFLALVGGTIKTSNITNHAKSNMYVIEQFLPVSFTVKENTITSLFIQQ